MFKKPGDYRANGLFEEGFNGLQLKLYGPQMSHATKTWGAFSPLLRKLAYAYLTIPVPFSTVRACYGAENIAPWTFSGWGGWMSGTPLLEIHGSEWDSAVVLTTGKDSPQLSI